MDQRRLRLGDILDDYCPRERRVTNHAVVAMIEEDVKQTRCLTCDAEHVYKGGKAPRRKKSESTGALYKEVLAGITDEAAPQAPSLHAAHPPASDDPDALPESVPESITAAPEEDESAIHDEADVEGEAALPADDAQPADDGPVHRPLIRAQLPRPEGVKIERQAPDFTIRNNAGRGNGNFRGGDSRGRGGAGGGGGRAGHGGHAAGGHRFGRGPNRGGGAGNQRFDRGPRKRSR
jgi:uncharacterized membrane protein YgcG